MAFFRTKFQIFGLLVSNKNKYNLFLRQQPWHSARPVLRFKKNVNEDRYNDKESSLVKVLLKGSERYGKKKKMRFLNIRTILPTKTEERSIINRKTQPLLKRKLTFWEYVFGPKKSLDFFRPIFFGQKKMHHKENSYNQVIRESGDENVVNNTEQVIKSLRNAMNLEPQSPIYKIPTSVLLNRMMTDGLYEKNNNEDKTITFATTRRSHDEIKPPSNFQKIELRTDAKSENIEEPVPQMSTQISAVKARDSLTKIPNQAIKREKSRRHSRIEQLEILVNEKKTELKRASRINSHSENSNK